KSSPPSNRACPMPYTEASNNRAATLALALLTAVCILQSADCSRRPATLATGSRVEGVLSARDAVRGDLPRGPEARWYINGRKGESCRIASESYEFDTYLLLLDPRGRQVASANGNGELFSSVIKLNLPEDGRFTVVVCGSSADQYGTYWISFQNSLDDEKW